MPEKDKANKSDAPQLCRRDVLKKKGIEHPELPPCDCLHIAAWLFEIGPTLGKTPLTHAEIESWQRNTGIELDAWQARTLRRLSCDYLDESYSARQADCPAPWITDYVHAVPSQKVETLRSAVRALANL